MMWQINCRLLFSFIALGLGLSARAQAPAGTAQQRIEFTIILGDGRAPVGAFVVNPSGGESALAINSSARSPAYQHSGPGPLAIWSRSAPGAERKPVAAVNLPPQARRVLVVLMANPKAHGGQPSHVGVAIPDEWEGAPVGTVRFLNFTGRKVAGELRGQAIDVPPGASKPFAVGANVAEPVTIPLRLAQLDGENYRMFYDGALKTNGKERLTTLLLPPRTDGGLCRIRTLRESAPTIGK